MIFSTVASKPSNDGGTSTGLEEEEEREELRKFPIF